MTRAKSWLLLLAAGAAVVVGLPLGARWLRPRDRGRCALDGLKIETLYQVRVKGRNGSSVQLCSIRCAERWLALQDLAPVAVSVTDEASGDEIDAATAWFVKSAVVTNPVTRNRVHAFRDKADAEAHARDFHGDLLKKGERPLRIIHADPD